MNIWTTALEWPLQYMSLILTKNSAARKTLDKFMSILFIMINLSDKNILIFFYKFQIYTKDH